MVTECCAFNILKVEVDSFDGHIYSESFSYKSCIMAFDN